MQKIKKTGIVKTMDTHEDVAGLSIQDNMIHGTIFAHGGGRPHCVWDINGKSKYPNQPDLNMLNIEIYCED